MSQQPARSKSSVRPSKVESGEGQKCLKCKKVKKFSEFHRRGVGYQRICKTCRKAHIPSGEKRIIVLNSPTLYPELMQRIESLEPKLRGMSIGFANGDNMEADDIYAVMVEEILFKSNPKDSDARIITRAKWAAKAVLRRLAAYSALVGSEEEMSSEDEDGGLEINVSFHNSAEAEYAALERGIEIGKIIKQLPPEYSEIVSLLSLGYSQHEISIRFHLSDQAISHKVKKIAVEFRNLGFSPI